MAKDRISQLYERHKDFPRGRNSEDHPAPCNPARYDHSPKDGALRNNFPQDIEDSHDNYREQLGLNVRFTPKSEHWNSAAKCPLCAIS